MATAEEHYQLGEGFFFPKTKQTHSKAAIFCELLCDTDQPIQMDFCQSSANSKQKKGKYFI